MRTKTLRIQDAAVVGDVPVQILRALKIRHEVLGLGGLPNLPWACQNDHLLLKVGENSVCHVTAHADYYSII